MNSTNLNRNKLRFLDPEVLSRISNFELLARTVVEGFVSGLHKSPYKGFSVEFMEYRQYVPGDDLKRLDWKLYARTDKLFVKEFEDETNTTCHIMLDISKSMGYSSAKLNKLQYGSYLAATMAYFMIKQRDSVGLYLFDKKITTLINPKSTTGHLHSILTTLENNELGDISDMSKPFHELADAIKKRGIVIIITDLLDHKNAIINGLKHFAFNGNEVLLFHILDPVENDFDFEEIVELEDMETGEKMLILGDAAREIYMDNLNNFKEEINQECRLLSIDYKSFVTNIPLDFALFEYLAARSRLN